MGGQRSPISSSMIFLTFLGVFHPVVEARKAPSAVASAAANRPSKWSLTSSTESSIESLVQELEMLISLNLRPASSPPPPPATPSGPSPIIKQVTAAGSGTATDIGSFYTPIIGIRRQPSKLRPKEDDLSRSPSPPPPTPKVSPPSRPITSDIHHDHIHDDVNYYIQKPSQGDDGYERPARSPPPAPRVSPPSRPLDRSPPPEPAGGQSKEDYERPAKSPPPPPKVSPPSRPMAARVRRSPPAAEADGFYVASY